MSHLHPLHPAFTRAPAVFFSIPFSAARKCNGIPVKTVTIPQKTNYAAPPRLTPLPLPPATLLREPGAILLQLSDL